MLVPTAEWMPQQLSHLPHTLVRAVLRRQSPESTSPGAGDRGLARSLGPGYLPAVPHSATHALPGGYPIAQMITVAIVDDNRLVREALTAMLRDQGDLRVVASASPDPAFLREHDPHVLLLDAGLGDADSLLAAAALVTELPGARIVVMDVIPVNEEIVEYVNAGVWGFVLKDATFEEFLATIRSVAGGAKVLPPRMTDSLFSQIVKSAVAREPAAVIADVRMTRREHEVVNLIGEGLSNKEIAQRLNIATHTVKSHVRNVMEKLTLHTRLQIAAYHHRDGAE